MPLGGDVSGEKAIRGGGKTPTNVTPSPSESFSQASASRRRGRLRFFFLIRPIRTKGPDLRQQRRDSAGI